MEPKQRIPLTLGFANFSGDDLGGLVSEDLAVLGPLFERVNAPAPHLIPKSEILFVYAHLNDDGTIRGPKTVGIRQIVQATQARLVVLASPNSTASLKKGASLPGPKTANIVLTLDRKGGAFAQFFRTLFDKMRDGEHMLSAWVQLAPQGPQPDTGDIPATILIAEAGKLAFPKPK
jgi:hypothetical protein